jgi:hypothetical protein
MPIKRPIEEEAFLTRPSSPRGHPFINKLGQKGNQEYALDYSGADPDLETQSLLTSSTLVNGRGLGYRDGTGEDDEYDIDGPPPNPRRISAGKAQRRYRRILGLAGILAVLLLGGVISRRLLYGAPPRNRFSNDPHVIMSNGTHDYKKTVLLVSIDGLR